MSECCGKDPSPKWSVGQRIHHKEKIGDVRLGAAATYRLKFVGDEWFVISVHAGDGRYLGEKPYFVTEFEEKYEACPGV